MANNSAGKNLTKEPSRTKRVSARERSGIVVERLAAEFPKAECALFHRNPLELLIATILSAQCTDERVNMVTPVLFDRYCSPREYGESQPGEIENIIKSTGFFRAKANNIRKCCKAIAEKHGGKVPETLEELVKLAGIGRKTANVVLGTAMGLATGVVVDTHVRRLSNRMGLTRHKDPVKIERVLMKLIDKSEWINFSHRMIHHGRKTCSARKPDCESCCITDVCPKIGVKRK